MQRFRQKPADQAAPLGQKRRFRFITERDKDMMQKAQQADIKQHGRPEPAEPDQVFLQAEITDSHRDKDERENDCAQSETVGHHIMQELTGKTRRQPCARGQQKQPRCNKQEAFQFDVFPVFLYFFFILYCRLLFQFITSFVRCKERRASEISLVKQVFPLISLHFHNDRNDHRTAPCLFK